MTAEILPYVSTTCRRLPPPWWLAFVWLAMSLGIWWNVDWWAYIDEGGGKAPWRKFELPLWFQLTACAALGLLAAAAVFGALVLMRRRRCHGPPRRMTV